MHWFWRAVIAVAAGGVWVFFGVPAVHRMYSPGLGRLGWWVIGLAPYIGVAFVCLTVYGLLTRR